MARNATRRIPAKGTMVSFVQYYIALNTTHLKDVHVLLMNHTLANTIFTLIARFMKCNVHGSTNRTS